jgi:protein-disulfide isomerase
MKAKKRSADIKIYNSMKIRLSMTMNKYQVILAGLVMLTISNVFASSFDDKQKDDIGLIVHDYLVAHPEVIAEAIQVLQGREAKAWEEKSKDAIAKNRADIFNSNSPTLENGAAKVTLVEFFDYNCPHCQAIEPMIERLVSQNKDIRIVYKELPVLGESSLYAAKAALAAREQDQYINFHQKLMARHGELSNDKVISIAKDAGLDVAKLQKDMESPKVQQELDDTRKQAIAIGLRGTPSIVIAPNPATAKMPIELIYGETNLQDLIKRIDAVE